MESKVQKMKKAPMLQKKTMVSQQKNQVSVVCISRDYENG